MSVIQWFIWGLGTFRDPLLLLKEGKKIFVSNSDGDGKGIWTMQNIKDGYRDVNSLLFRPHCHHYLSQVYQFSYLQFSLETNIHFPSLTRTKQIVHKANLSPKKVIGNWGSKEDINKKPHRFYLTMAHCETRIALS